MLKGGIALGATLAADRMAWPAGGEHLPPVFFFEGGLEGESFHGWEFTFSVAGSRAQGFAFDPSTADGQLQGLRFEGRVQGDRRLAMSIYALEDLNHLRAIGLLLGTGNDGGVQGTFVLPLDRRGPGAFHARVVPVSEDESQALVGSYQAAAQDQGGSQLYDAVLSVLPGHQWELRSIHAAAGLPGLGGSAARRLKGRYSVAEDGRAHAEPDARAAPVPAAGKRAAARSGGGRSDEWRGGRARSRQR